MKAVIVIARLTLLALARTRLGLAGLGVAGLLVFAGFGLRDLGFGVPAIRFLLNVGFGVISVGGVLLAVLGTTAEMFSDRDSRWLHFVLSRPVERREYLAGKLLGVLAMLGLYVLVVGLVLGAVLAGKTGGGVWGLPWGELLIGGLLLWVKAAVVAALALLVCSFARTELFANVATLLLVVIGHLKTVMGDAVNWTWQGGLAALLRVVPDFQSFEPADWVEAAGMGPLRVGGYGLAFVFAYGWAAALFFRRREI